MAESTNIVAEAASRIFADLADPQTVNSATDNKWQGALWQQLAENGLPLAWVSEDHGGSGVSLADGFELLSVAGRFGIAVPLAETMLAGWLLSQGGISSPEGKMSVAPAHPKDKITVNADGSLSGRARSVPFAREAEHYAVLAQGPKGVTIALVAAKDCRRDEGVNLAGEPLDAVIFDKTPVLQSGAVAQKDFTQTSLMLMGSVVRAQQISGALQYMLTRSVDYSQERTAFEKKISKFQAVQHNLAKLAGETAAAVAAAGSAADTLSTSDKWDDATFLESSAAKIRCAEAAGTGSAIAHQVHGAIGFTEEHVLHRFTLRAMGWRDDFGNESYWAVELGNMIAARGADDLWPLVASR